MVISYSLLSAIGFVVVGIQVWRNIMALNNKSTKQSLAPEQRRRAVMLVSSLPFCSLQFITWSTYIDWSGYNRLHTVFCC